MDNYFYMDNYFLAFKPEVILVIEKYPTAKSILFFVFLGYKLHALSNISQVNVVLCR